MAVQMTFDFGRDHVAANEPLYSNKLFKAVRRDRDFYSSLTARRQWRLLMERAKWCCESCGDNHKLQIDHIIPIAAGGDQYCLANQRILCERCHKLKTSMDYMRYGWQAK